MRVVCDNCGASYKIPESKLTKELNKATCRKCGRPIFIRRAVAAEEPRPADAPVAGEERTLITSAAELERQARSRAGVPGASLPEPPDPRPTQLTPDLAAVEATVPREEDAEPMAGAGPPTFVSAAPPPLAPAGQLQSSVQYIAAGSASRTLAPEQAAAIDPSKSEVFLRPAAAPPPPPPPPPSAVRAASFYESAMEPTAPPGTPVLQPAPTGWPGASPQAPAPQWQPPATSAPPAPAPQRVPIPATETARVVPGAHDPRGDLGVALVGALLAVGGAFLLLVATAAGVGVASAGAAFLVLFGASLSTLILVTGARGTRPASWVLSGMLALFAAVIGAAAQGFASYGGGYSERLPPVVASAPPKVEKALPLAQLETTRPPEPTPPPAAPVDPAAALTTTTAPAEPVAPVAVTPPTPPATTPPATTPPATSTSAPTTSTTVTTTAPATTTSRTSSTPTSTSTSTTASKPVSTASKPTTTTRSTAPKEPTSYAEETSAPERIPARTSSTSRTTAATSAPSSSSESKAASLDVKTVDIMIKNNKGVKLCFIKEQKNSGDVPHGVKVRMTIGTSGKVSSARISGGTWAGTEFDTCLSGAVAAIQFPPFEGDPLSLTYPFAI